MSNTINLIFDKLKKHFYFILSRNFDENIHERVKIIKERMQRACFHKTYIDYIQNEVTLEMGSEIYLCDRDVLNY